MKRVQLCCGDNYLRDFENCDHDGYVWDSSNLKAIRSTCGELGEDIHIISFPEGNPNETVLENYFSRPFEADSSKRTRRLFILDTQMDILKEWPWEDGTIDEIVAVSCFEHFEHIGEIPHIVSEAHRVLKSGGVWKFDFPDIKKTVEDYYESAPEFCIELLYCNHKNRYSIHNWGYTTKSIGKYLQGDMWDLVFRDVVTHDYPMQGVWATKKDTQVSLVGESSQGSRI